jgi:hypothetical protein
VSRRRSRMGGRERLTRSGVDQLIRLLGEEAELTKRVHPHLLRHSFATWALAQGVNPIQLAQIMGHSSLAMIQTVYAHLTPQDAYSALEAISRAEAQWSWGRMPKGPFSTPCGGRLRDWAWSPRSTTSAGRIRRDAQGPSRTEEEGPGQRMEACRLPRTSQRTSA